MSSSPWPCSTAVLELGADRAQRGQLQTGVLRGGQREPGVLGGEREREARLVGPLDHHRALHLRVRRAERAAVDDVQERRRVDAEALGQRDRLAEPSISASSHALSTSFIRVEAPGSSPRSTVRRADGVEHRRAAVAARVRRRRSRSACPAPPAPWCRAPARRRTAPRRPPSAARSPRSRPCSSAPRPSPAAASRPSITASTAAPSESIVTTISASSTASAGVSQTVTPSPASGSARSRAAVPGAHVVAGGGDVAGHGRAHDAGAQHGDDHQ